MGESAWQCWLSKVGALRQAGLIELEKPGGQQGPLRVSPCAGTVLQRPHRPLHYAFFAALTGASLSAVAMVTPARGAAEGQLGSQGFLGLSKQGALNCPHRRWALSCQRKGGREMDRDKHETAPRAGRGSFSCGFAGRESWGVAESYYCGSLFGITAFAQLSHLVSLPRSVFRAIDKDPWEGCRLVGGLEGHRQASD